MDGKHVEKNIGSPMESSGAAAGDPTVKDRAAKGRASSLVDPQGRVGLLSGPLVPTWSKTVDNSEIVFRSMVSLHSARTIGVEACLRGHERADFAAVTGIPDFAFEDGCLPEIEAAFLEKAMAGFCCLDGHANLKLFLTVDGRTLAHGHQLAPLVADLTERSALRRSCLVLAIAERHPAVGHIPVQANPQAMDGLKVLREVVGNLLIDNFGTGCFSFPLLYDTRPDYLKITRYFIGDIGHDVRKKSFMRHMVNIAHLSGIQVVADGVENEKEYLICKDVGCDLVQGALLGLPEGANAVSLGTSAQVRDLNLRDKRQGRSDQKLIQQEINHITPIKVSAELERVFERLRLENATVFFPVVNDANEPLGLVRESDLRSYAYSPFGRDLLSNKNYGRQMRDFLIPCPVADINLTAEKILEIFSADTWSEGLLIVDGGSYAGFLSVRSLLRILNEKNLVVARDQNPLTKLPGNTRINEFLAEVLSDSSTSCIIAYIDFDNFKPFNDTYGFRQGDRAITLFADILNKDVLRYDCFIGHVGGDDFFAAFRDVDFDQAQAIVHGAISRFRHDVESFYDGAARARGYIVARDRGGTERRMPLLAASAALVHIPRGHAPKSIDDISSVIALIKKESKASPSKMASVSII